MRDDPSSDMWPRVKLAPAETPPRRCAINVPPSLAYTAARLVMAPADRAVATTLERLRNLVVPEVTGFQAMCVVVLMVLER